MQGPKEVCVCRGGLGGGGVELRGGFMEGGGAEGGSKWPRPGCDEAHREKNVDSRQPYPSAAHTLAAKSHLREILPLLSNH